MGQSVKLCPVIAPMKPLSSPIYLDYAASTPLCHAAFSAMCEAMTRFVGNPSSLHACGREAAAALAQARATIASLMHCDAEEVFFTSGGSESDNQALMTLAAIARQQGKTHLITSEIEHPAVLDTVRALMAQGFTADVIPPAPCGVLSCATLLSHIRPETAFVSIMAANNETGILQPVLEMATLCRERGILFHTDAVQAVGTCPFSLRDSAINLLCASAHKFGGPRGIGFLIARGVTPRSLIHGGGQERGARAGTENLPAICGMVAALTQTVKNREALSAHCLSLRKRLEQGLSLIPDTQIVGREEPRLPGHVLCLFDGLDGEALLWMLDEYGICVSTGSACSALGGEEEGRVLRAMGFSAEKARSALRITFGMETTSEQIDMTIRALTEITTRLRNARHGASQNLPSNTPTCPPNKS